MAVVVEICRLREENKRDENIGRYHAGIFPGRGSGRGSTDPSGKEGQRSSGASTFIRLALEGVASRLVAAEREVQWASSTLAGKSKGRHYASSHKYSLTRTRPYKLYTL